MADTKGTAKVIVPAEAAQELAILQLKAKMESQNISKKGA